MIAVASSKVIHGRHLAPSATYRDHATSPQRLQVVAARAHCIVDLAALKASPKGEGFNPPSVGQ
jgi:hypothetical protein